MDKQLDYFQEEQIDIKEYIFKLLRFWYIYPATLILAIVIAYFYIQFKTPIYEIQTTLLIQDEQSLMDPEAILQAEVFSPMSFMKEYKLQNEIQILKSYRLCEETIKKLNFEVSYHESDNFRTSEIYTSSPYVVEYDSSHVQLTGFKFSIRFVSKDQVYIWGEGEECQLYNYRDKEEKGEVLDFNVNDSIKLNVWYESEYYKFRLKKKDGVEVDAEKEYFFMFHSYESLAWEFSQFEIEEVKYSSVLKILSAGGNVKKLMDFQNELVKSYLNRGVDKKNRIAINTVNFIDEQLLEITDSLRKVENRLREFRSSEQVMNIDFKAQQNYKKLEQIQSEKASLILNMKYYEYLKSYLSEDEEFTDLVVPTSMGVSDPLLNRLIIDLTSTYTEKAEVMVNTKKDNPYLESVNHKIESQKKSLSENVDNLINQTEISLLDIDERLKEISDEVQHLPETQRQLLNIEREFELQNDMYTFLMRKKSEMQIAKASNLPSHEVLDYPRLVDNKPISPNKKVVYIVAFLLGLGMPVGLILLFDYFNDKLDNSKEIEKITDFPILGNILRSKEGDSLVVHHHPRSVIAEAFRSIRTNFQFIQADICNPVVLITSSMMGEGKSFISLNLASSFALFDKKVLVLSFDLRRPTLTKLLDVKWENGLSTYLSGRCEVDDIIFETKVKNLSIIPSGTIPPNPSELIASERTEKLFTYLKTKFDYIIVDTPPVGIVADALLLMNHSDINLFITRHNYSRKKMFGSVVKNLEQKNIKNLNIIVNDIGLTGRKYDYHYGYGYGYGYSYEYK